jgi:hypothetical protein
VSFLPAISTLNVSAAAGNIVTLSGMNFPASGGSVIVTNQGTNPDTFDDTQPSYNFSMTVSGATFDPVSGAYVTFPLPDALGNGTVLNPAGIMITSASGNSNSIPLQVKTQYVTSAEYMAAGEGVDLSTLAPGELDQVLQKASDYVDSYVGYSFRYQPVVDEQHTWKGHMEDVRLNTRIYPFVFPITPAPFWSPSASGANQQAEFVGQTFVNTGVDLFRVRISNSQYATFPSLDVIVNDVQKYVEILSYAVASYTLLGAIQMIGLVANIVELYYWGGWPVNMYPTPLKTGVIMVATEMLTYRSIQRRGFGGLSQVKQGQQTYQRRNEQFAIPQPAREVLRQYKRRFVR